MKENKDLRGAVISVADEREYFVLPKDIKQLDKAIAKLLNDPNSAVSRSIAKNTMVTKSRI